MRELPKGGRWLAAGMVALAVGLTGCGSDGGTADSGSEYSRDAVATPAGAEVETGTGYDHTLFDSADKKCQHCHNDLYDTWDKSMHAKSWKDPIFQAKFQDFLRLKFNKIVDSRTAKTKTKFKKVAQTCIRCHAPTAFYSGDFKVTLNQTSTNPGDYTRNVSNDVKASSYDPEKATTVPTLSKDDKVFEVG